jgi:hypothetical protein
MQKNIRQTEEFLNEKYMKMERNARVHEISFYCGAIKACEFLDMNGNEMKTESIHC